MVAFISGAHLLYRATGVALYYVNVVADWGAWRELISQLGNSTTFPQTESLRLRWTSEVLERHSLSRLANREWIVIQGLSPGLAFVGAPRSSCIQLYFHGPHFLRKHSRCNKLLRDFGLNYGAFEKGLARVG